MEHVRLRQIKKQKAAVVTKCLALAVAFEAILNNTATADEPLRQSSERSQMTSKQIADEGHACNSKGNPPYILPGDCYANPNTFVTTRVDGMLFRIPSAYYGPYLLRSTTERIIDAPFIEFPFWMPDGRPSARDMGSMVITDWRRPETGWTTLKDDQHIVMVRTLRPLRPDDGNLTPYQSLKLMREQFASGWPRQEDEFGLAKFMHLAAPQDFEYATTEDGDQQLRILCRRSSKYPHGLFACQGQFYSRSDQLLFNLQFLANYMKDWRAITDQALKLVRSWKLDDETK